MQLDMSLNYTNITIIRFFKICNLQNPYDNLVFYFKTNLEIAVNRTLMEELRSNIRITDINQINMWHPQTIAFEKHMTVVFFPRNAFVNTFKNIYTRVTPILSTPKFIVSDGITHKNSFVQIGKVIVYIDMFL